MVYKNSEASNNGSCALLRLRAMDSFLIRSLSLSFAIISFVLFCSMMVSVSATEPSDGFKLDSEKKTHLHLYFHDNVSGPNVTALRVAPAGNASRPLTFGDIVVIDDPLTVGPSPSSKLVGRAQGFYAQASQQSLELALTMNFVFVAGKYNGSTLTIVWWNPILHTTREMPVVGGTGIFRLARGYAIAKTFIFNQTSGNAIVEFNVFVLHYGY